jgi:FSR family fosmidomycin resistance protein-like MFS transporter
VGPLAAAFIVLPRGQRSVAWFSLAALLAIVVLWRVGGWYGRRRASAAGVAAVRGPTRTPVPVGQVRVALAVLIVLGAVRRRSGVRIATSDGGEGGTGSERVLVTLG